MVNPTTPSQPQTEVAKKTIIVILVLGALLLLTIAIVYIVFLIKKSGLKKADLQKKLLALDDKQLVPFKIPNGLMSIVNRGQEYSLSLWIYLSPIYEQTSDHKLVFQRGNTTQIPNAYDGNTNPLIFLDRSTNKMYFAVGTSASDSSYAQTLTRITSTDDNGRYDSGFLVTYIDYLPLQRWVHTVLVVRDNSMMVFMDGDLYSVASVSEMPSAMDTRPILRTSQGDASMGDINTLTKGYVSKAQYFNYGLNQQDIQSLYKGGPMRTGWLSWLGISSYGMRSPIYNLDDSDATA